MTDKLNKSPDKNKFAMNAMEKYNSTDVDIFSLFLNLDREKLDRENDPAWQKNNLEYDLRSTDWVIDKVKDSTRYAQNLYAALCNNEFVQRDDTWNILKEEYWSCSWRYAGGIIADIQETGDYIDWYCSGIHAQADVSKSGYTSEGVITDEIKEDLKKLGWVVIPNKDNDYI